MFSAVNDGLEEVQCREPYCAPVSWLERGESFRVSRCPLLRLPFSGAIFVRCQKTRTKGLYLSPVYRLVRTPGARAPTAKRRVAQHSVASRGGKRVPLTARN